MDLLTYRLTGFMHEIEEKQIEEIIKKERLQREQLINRNNCTQKSSQPSSIKSLMYMKKKEKENNICEEERLKRKKIGAVSLWNSSRKKNAENKDPESTKGKSKTVDKSKNRFLNAAKMAVLISQVKQGRDICTCESLDANCKLHDV